MSSMEIHQLGVELERFNGELKPVFEKDANNSADSYDYGNGLLLGVRMGAARLLERFERLEDGRFGPAHLLEDAISEMTELHNDIGYDIHKHPREMAIILHLFGALLGAEQMISKNSYGLK